MKGTKSRRPNVRIWDRCKLLAPAFVLAMVFVFLISPCLLAGPTEGLSSNGKAGLQASSAVSGDGEHYLGLLPSPPGDYPQIAVPQTLQSTLSASVDLSSQLPPVGDQGKQGSCAAWASSYYYKSWSEKQEHTAWNLTNPYYQFSPSFVYNQINGGVDRGSTFRDAFTLMQNVGDVDIAEMPYSQNNYTAQPAEAQLQAAKPYKIAGDWAAFWTRSSYGYYFTPNNIDGIKAWLNSGKMLVMAIPVYTDFPNYGGNPSKPYYDHSGYFSVLAGGHGVCICGYDDNINPGGSNADRRGGFKMVNSWGPGWNGASAGYVYLSYNFVKRYVAEAWAINDVSPDTPSIASLSATEAKPGSVIHIYGNNFGTLRRKAKVTFNGVDATGVSFTNTDITATVPAPATSGPLVVYDWDGITSNSIPFTVIGANNSPKVTSVSPTSGAQNSVVAITAYGNNFQSGASVRLELDGTVIDGTGVNFVSDTEIQATFDLTGAPVTTFDLVVKNPDGFEGSMKAAFAVTAPCGTGASLSMMLFGLMMGLLSLAGSGSIWRRRLRKAG